MITGQVTPYVEAETEKVLTVNVYKKEMGKTESLYYDGKEHRVEALFDRKQVCVKTGDFAGEITVQLHGYGRKLEQKHVQGECIFILEQ